MKNIFLTNRRYDLGEILINEEKYNELIRESIKDRNENVDLKNAIVFVKSDLGKLSDRIKERDVEILRISQINKLQDKILSQYSEYNITLNREITKLKDFIIENFEEFRPVKDDGDIEKELQNFSSRDDLSASFVGKDGKLYSAQSIFDISILLLKKLKELKDLGYGSFLESDGNDNTEI